MEQSSYLDSSLFAPGDVITIAGLIRGTTDAHFIISQPLFSQDSLRAYIALDRVCPGCGAGTGYYLQKKGTTWEVVSSDLCWIN
ncbi:MAG: hypothetical protein JWP58_3777 [Hymenobacter sp.]|nr:hypothetical protein [Hymenobacter sp.]